MRATGQIQFTRQPDGTVTRKWTGGRRVAIGYEALRVITGVRPRIGDVVYLQPDLPMRLLDLDFNPHGAGCSDNYIAMREGLIARMVYRYVRWLHDNAHLLYKWECRWLRRRAPQEGGAYPKWSIPSILMRPLL